MKAYWDASALVQSVVNPTIKQRLENERAFTRPHTLTETFSTLTGNPATRIDANDAAAILDRLARSLDFVDVTGPEILKALRTARQKGVRGGRVHDFIHAIAAEKSGAAKIFTLDKNDFTDLTGLQIEQA
jgi:predicted nucleic acid-binding protein